MPYGFASMIEYMQTLLNIINKRSIACPFHQDLIPQSFSKINIHQNPSEVSKRTIWSHNVCNQRNIHTSGYVKNDSRSPIFLGESKNSNPALHVSLTYCARIKIQRQSEEPQNSWLYIPSPNCKHPTSIFNGRKQKFKKNPFQLESSSIALAISIKLIAWPQVLKPRWLITHWKNNSPIQVILALLQTFLVLLLKYSNSNSIFVDARHWELTQWDITSFVQNPSKQFLHLVCWFHRLGLRGSLAKENPGNVCGTRHHDHWNT